MGPSDLTVWRLSRRALSMWLSEWPLPNSEWSRRGIRERVQLPPGKTIDGTPAIFRHGVAKTLIAAVGRRYHRHPNFTQAFKLAPAQTQTRHFFGGKPSVGAP